jgi:hypothetical protein
VFEGTGSTRSDGFTARKVRSGQQGVSGINPTNAISVMLAEIAMIETGVDELKPPPGSLPENV